MRRVAIVAVEVSDVPYGRALSGRSRPPAARSGTPARATGRPCRDEHPRVTVVNDVGGFRRVRSELTQVQGDVLAG